MMPNTQSAFILYTELDTLPPYLLLAVHMIYKHVYFTVVAICLVPVFCKIPMKCSKNIQVVVPKTGIDLVLLCIQTIIRSSRKSLTPS